MDISVRLFNSTTQLDDRVQSRDGDGAEPGALRVCSRVWRFFHCNAELN